MNREKADTMDCKNRKWNRPAALAGALAAAAIMLAVMACPDPNFPVYTEDITVGQMVKYVNNPVLSRGLPGSFDDLGAGSPAVLIEKNGQLRMYFSASNTAGLDTIGTAVSQDGLVWVKKADAPVLTPTTGFFDQGGVFDPAVLFDGKTYWLYYMGRDNDGKGRVGLATSVDGIVFQKFSGPVLEGGKEGFDALGVSEPYVIFDSEKSNFYMLYTGIGNDGAGRIMMATSKNGTTWAKYGQEKGLAIPVLFPSSQIGDFDTHSLSGPSGIIVKTKEGRRIIRMWYSGDNGVDGTVHVGLAGAQIADDGTLVVPPAADAAWTLNPIFERYPSNPVLHYARRPCELLFLNNLYMFYTETAPELSSGIAVATRYELGGSDGGSVQGDK
jgi:predicted GH43/DUF377 family glycosyl hydrolase